MQRGVFARILLDSALAITVALVFGGVVGLVYSAVQPRTYAATARVVVVADRDLKTFGELAKTYLSERRVRNYRSLLTSPALLERSITYHGLPTTAQYLEENLTVTSPKGTSLIDITITAPTGQLAADYSTSLAQEFVNATSELENRGAIHVALVGNAVVPARPEHPRTTLNAINAALAFGLAATLVNFYRARRNPKLQYFQGIATIDGVPVIGNIPIGKRTYVSGRRSQHRRSAKVSQDVRGIAERLLARAQPERGSVVEVVSPDPRLGELMTDMLSRNLADGAGVTTVNESVSGTIAVLAPPVAVRVGVISSASRWQEAVAFARTLRGDARVADEPNAERRALLVIADGVKL